MDPSETTLTPPSPGVPGEGVRARTRIFVLLFLALHAFAAIAVWWAVPGGFPVTHPRFLANRVVPAAVVAYAAAIFVLGSRKQWPAVATLLLASPIAWIGAAVGGMLVFPVSGRWPAVAAMVAAITVILAIRRHFAMVWPSRRTLMAIVILLLPLGGALPLTQRSLAPATQPDGPSVAGPASLPLDRIFPTQRISDITSIVPGTGQVVTRFSGHSVEILPLLTFGDRSPDRCWTCLAPRTARQGTLRRLCKFGFRDGEWNFVYRDEGSSELHVSDDKTKINITAECSLPDSVYSHLNSFNEITIGGHRKLSLIFSPAPTTPIEVTHSEYPIGRPQRSAYLGPDRTFRIVEATSGEKGPFHKLASGPLRRGWPLTITLLDDGVPFARLTFADFSAQASTQLSPTAGWGYPENAIEFYLEFPEMKSQASIIMCLASSSVGRGWDSVGHAPGLYRNRVTLEYLNSEPGTK